MHTGTCVDGIVHPHGLTTPENMSTDYEYNNNPYRPSGTVVYHTTPRSSPSPTPTPYVQPFGLLIPCCLMPITKNKAEKQKIIRGGIRVCAQHTTAWAGVHGLGLFYFFHVPTRIGFSNPAARR